VQQRTQPKGTAVAKFEIVGIGQDDWSIEADNYRVDDAFFHFFSASSEQLFAVRKDSVLTVRSSLADKN
jgi:hypothetical protein